MMNRFWSKAAVLAAMGILLASCGRSAEGTPLQLSPDRNTMIFFYTDA
jgi:hypothetical protein